LATRQRAGVQRAGRHDDAAVDGGSGGLQAEQGLGGRQEGAQEPAQVRHSRHRGHVRRPRLSAQGKINFSAAFSTFKRMVSMFSAEWVHIICAPRSVSKPFLNNRIQVPIQFKIMHGTVDQICPLFLIF
jgi:hypothetical protein